MLVSLTIHSFLLIDALDLQASDGFTALTGETGAGKSILLKALDLTLGGPTDRALIRHGTDQATLVATFCVTQTHPVWDLLDAHGLTVNRQEPLLLKRVLKTAGPSRAFINDLPVSAALLAQTGAALVEIHGQYASTDLLRPKSHQALLDHFGNLDTLVTECRRAWQAYQTAQDAVEQAETRAHDMQASRAWHEDVVTDLQALAPQPGEYEALLSERARHVHAEKVSHIVTDALACLDQEAVRTALCQAERCLQNLTSQSCLQEAGSELGGQANAAFQATERCLIELTEAQSLTHHLALSLPSDPTRLDALEDRLAALRGRARQLNCSPDSLPDTLASYQTQLAGLDREEDVIQALKQACDGAETRWQQCGAQLSAARRKAAHKLAKRVQVGLAPLHLDRVRFRVQLIPISPDMSGAEGLEHVSFEVETNPGLGFGPLQAIASGGELARFSLALKCALHQGRTARTTLIFDEIDQGVGGAVATALGDRLAHLSGDHQVLAITHSPQVAACADQQWQVCKQTTRHGCNSTQIRTLNKAQRLEEIARMLSGSSITDEARAAASRLLEVA